MDVIDPLTLGDERCHKVKRVLSHVGDKWSVLIIVTLIREQKRFSALKREINDISQRMLALTLRNLERDGLVERIVTPSIPPRVDYRLTEMGHSLADPVLTLGQWAIEHLDRIDEANARYDAGNR
ncbi:winged helix-turn-helix transcriptional regulator [Bradyrhizobium manausense]|uniref:winged helix-turn-helix transcriptional regulator n=1 Tax=Bradyrhizobium manausense TaxID=989370 RepID=UPI001BAC2EBB|nr:helix-turn-helix domain-containing protein [Bradyrhizobium manausense]MBR0725522.1 helix-turn-helix transcriptional regulator [Bradyrhizobium manausense]